MIHLHQMRLAHARCFLHRWSEASRAECSKGDGNDKGDEKDGAAVLLPLYRRTTGTNSGPSVAGATGQTQTREARTPTRLSREKDGHLGGDDGEPRDGHEREWERIPVRKRALGDGDALLLEDRAPKQAGEACGEGEAHGANVARDGEGDRRGAVAVRGKLPRTHDLCEEDRRADVGSRDVAEDDTENADEPDGRVYLAVRGADEPGCEDVDPALVGEPLDEYELREGEGDEGEGEAGERGAEGGEMRGEAGAAGDHPGAQAGDEPFRGGRNRGGRSRESARRFCSGQL